MIKKITSLLVFLIAFYQTYAQEAFYKSYDWEETPSYPTKDIDEDLVELKSKILTEFFFIEEGLVEYFLEHRALFLNSDTTIEEYNKIYLPYSNSSKLLINKARVITPSHKIILLDESNIHTAENEETGRKFKYFALEGVEKGSVIEYYYVIQKYPDYQGRRLSFQQDHPKKNVEFDLYAPSNLIFSFKSYNNFPQVARDTVLDTEKKLHWYAKKDYIPSLEAEESSAYNANKQFVIYKLDKNLADNSSGISSYDQVSQKVYKRFYKETSRREEKAIEKFLKKIDKNGKEATTIKNIENYIKSNVYVSNGIAENLSDLETILEEKVANERGLVNLYISLFNYLNIKHELVFTSNRFELAFDPEFEASNFLNEYLIFFPNTETYLAPTIRESRYGYPPAEYTDNYGLFIKEIKVGNFKSGAGEIKYINPVASDKSYDKMNIKVKFDKNNIAKCNVDLEKSMFGYYAVYLQPFMNLMTKDNKEELLNNFLDNIQEGAELNKSEVINGKPELFGTQPLTLQFNFSSENLTEKAGNKYLFKVGKLIGKQIELYQEKERKLPLDEEFKREYTRTITIEIPQGYQVANLDDIILDETYSEDNKSLMAFKSSYKIDGHQLTITADEYYKTNHLPTDKFENYRRVINSAADFNKIVLVLEPKS